MSFREIARQVGCSDWTVRSIYRDLAGDSRPMKATIRAAYDQDERSPSVASIIICAAVFLALPFALIIGSRRS